MTSSFERDFGFPAGSDALLPCFYHWFGVSIVNFVRKIGFLQGIITREIEPPPFLEKSHRQKVSRYCTDYVKSVQEIAEAYVWRNKVFAHFASTDPYEEDNEALVQLVSFYPVSYSDGKLVVGGWQMYVGPDNVTGDPEITRAHSSNLPVWGMTDTFQKLNARYVFKVETVTSLPS